MAVQEKVSSDVDLEKGVLSCDDEGYETPGKKEPLLRPKPAKEISKKVEYNL